MKKKLQLRLITLFLSLFFMSTSVYAQNDLELKGIMALTWSTSGTNGGKAIHLRAKADIADLSVYAIGVANNGGGSDSIEYRFPVMSVSAGDDILLAREDSTLSAYFGSCSTEFEHVIQGDIMSQNGDDPIELYGNTTVIETYGDVQLDGTGLEWEYTGTWAYKDNDVWTYGALNCAANDSIMETSACPYPLCDFGVGSDAPNDLELKGIMALLWNTSGTNGGKAIHLRAKADIADLSVYAIGVANNGGGTDSIEYRFPVMSVSAGDDILLAREDSTLSAYFGSCSIEFEHVLQSDIMNQNGDDPIELFGDTTVIETYGDVQLDGSGLEWEYTGTWAYKDNYVWTYGGLNCAANDSIMETSACPYPLCASPLEGIERSVLFIGNSYTFYNDMPGLVQQLAASVGDVLIQDENAEGSYSLEDHLSDENSIAKIKKGGWDYVVLQEQSTRPVREIDIVEAQTFSIAAALDSIRKLANPVGDVMFYMTWGRKGTYEGLSFQEMNDLIGERYRTMQSNQNGLISPVGAVWSYLRNNSPGIDLYDPDESHPSKAGSYLSACTFYASIFQKDPTALSYDFDLSASDAQTIRAAVKAVVFDSLSFWNTYKPLANKNLSIAFDNITDGQIYLDTAKVDMTVTVSSTDSQIQEVHFIANGDTLATDNAAPFDPKVSLDKVGHYIVTAIATDVNGSKNYSVRNIIKASSDVPKDLALKGILALRWTNEPTVNSGKAIHLVATADIPDLSVYGIGVANNGGGTDGIEYKFPVMSVSAGDDILLAREVDVLTAYFGDCASEIEHVLQTDEMNQNGDDAIELFSEFIVIETYGDANTDGTGLEWEYTGSWAYKVNDVWTYGALNCAANSSSTQDSECIYPLCVEEVKTDVATLSDLQIDGETIVGFASGLLNYAVELPFNHETVPVVTALATDENANVDINPTAALPGITAIIVTAVDGTTQQTYSISFTLADGGEVLGNNPLSDLQLVVENDRVYLKGESLKDVRFVEVYSLTGRILHEAEIENTTSVEFVVPRNEVTIIRLIDDFGEVIYNRKIIINK
jgi:hypothetical protein